MKETEETGGGGEGWEEEMQRRRGGTSGGQRRDEQKGGNGWKTYIEMRLEKENVPKTVKQHGVCVCVCAVGCS